MTSIFWHRRDLRLHDNAGLFKALKSGDKIQPIFIFDTTILSRLNVSDQRVLFIHQEIKKLKEKYAEYGSDLKVFHGNPIELIPLIADNLNANAVYTNRDYEPYAIKRDKTLFELLKAQNCELIGAKDHVIFERQEVLTQQGRPFGVFTPYKNAWLRQLTDAHLSEHPTEPHAQALANVPDGLHAPIPTLDVLGFEPTNLSSLRLLPGSEGALTLLEDFLQRIEHYGHARDFPAIKGPSYLSVHLRFGTVSIRQLAALAAQQRTVGVDEAQQAGVPARRSRRRGRRGRWIGRRMKHEAGARPLMRSKSLAFRRLVRFSTH